MVVDRNSDSVKRDIRQFFFAGIIPGKHTPDKNGDKNEVGKNVLLSEVGYNSFKHF